MKEHKSLEDSERHFEQELESLENAHSCMSASLEKFSANPTDIGAKYLWLKHIILNEDVPEDVMKKMISIIKYDIQLYEDDRHTSHGALSKKEEREPIYVLLDLAKNNADDFWKILQTPSNRINIYQFNADLLEKARTAFPLKRKLKAGELYTFFGKQLGMKEEEEGNDSIIDIAERMRSRYRTYKKTKKAERVLFD